MKCKGLGALVTLLICSIFSPMSALANEGQASTTITILPQPIEVMSVTNVDFGIVSINDGVRTYQALDDFAVVIRKNQETAADWRLMLVSQPFNCAEGHQLENYEYTLGAGQVEIDQDWLPINICSEVKRVDAVSTSEATEVIRLMDHQGSSTITYRVPKENISLMVKENNQLGDYYAPMEWAIQDVL